MSDNTSDAPPIVVDPGRIPPGQGVRGEPLGCPTALNDPPEPPPGGAVDQPTDTTAVRGPLQVEKLEGRQESGRDAQDEAEEDEEEV